jgi:hypothetical protein
MRVVVTAPPPIPWCRDQPLLRSELCPAAWRLNFQLRKFQEWKFQWWNQAPQSGLSDLLG